MVVPLVILAFFSIVAGWWNAAGGFDAFMGHEAAHEVHGFFGGFFGILTHPVPLVSLAVALAGILTAYIVYSAKIISAESLGNIFKPLYLLFSRKYWLDELYENVIIRTVLYNGIFRAFSFFDSKAVDGAVNGIASGTSAASRVIRQAQTGQLQVYGMFIVIGIIAIALCVYLFG
jgi:NADH-quinone oxidoreductase subunit L